MRRHLYKAPRKNGFTLIEILVVFTIMAVLSGIGFASFVTYSQVQEISQTASNIRTLIGQARFNALSSVGSNISRSGIPIECLPTEQLTGYSVTVVSQTRIIMRQLCDGDGAGNDISVLTVPNNVRIADEGQPCNQIVFNVLSDNPAVTACTITLIGDYTLGEIKKTISIDGGGNVDIR